MLLNLAWGKDYPPMLDNNIVYLNLSLRDFFVPNNGRNKVSHWTQPCWIAPFTQMLLEAILSCPPPWVTLSHVSSSMGLLHGLLLRHSHISRSPYTLTGPLGIWFTGLLNLFPGEACFREIPVQIKKHREECSRKHRSPIPGTLESMEFSIMNSTQMLNRIAHWGSSDRAGMCPQIAMEPRDSRTPWGLGFPFLGGHIDYPEPGLLAAASATLSVFKILADRALPSQHCSLSAWFLPQPQAFFLSFPSHAPLNSHVFFSHWGSTHFTFTFFTRSYKSSLLTFILCVWVCCTQTSVLCPQKSE